MAHEADQSGQARDQEAIKLDKAWGTGRLFELMVWFASIGHDPEWFAQFVELEQASNVIRLYEADVIPGLLQNESYARSVIESGDAESPAEMLRERMERQRLFEREPRPVYLTALISQNAIEWPVGSPEIMRAQLQRLLDMSERPNVIIRIVPRSWDVGAYPGLDGAFELLKGTDFTDVAYTQSPGTGRLVSSPVEVERYVVRYDQISAKALPEGPSRELIRSVMEAFE
ncbi:DUF5753 domain-containing protein [Actinomadura sp. LOL_016]|uniref:DUF5753 domain-containing protein n=1 Tax=unclassified Actinomadura TaxID=2626254 RepID=UPI003A8085FB